MDVAWTCIRTSSGPGRGTSTSISSAPGSGLVLTTAFIFMESVLRIVHSQVGEMVAGVRRHSIPCRRQRHAPEGTNCFHQWQSSETEESVTMDGHNLPQESGDCPVAATWPGN